MIPPSRQMPAVLVTAPVVHKDHPKDVLVGSADRDWLPILVSRSHKECLKLKSKVLIKFLKSEIFTIQRVTCVNNQGWAGRDSASFPRHN